nr:MAG TPA: hypothetical protein [Caudoviricetes sp.]
MWIKYVRSWEREAGNKRGEAHTSPPEMQD